MISKPKRTAMRNWQIPVYTIAISILLMITGAFYYANEEKEITQNKQEALKAVAHLRINEITQWRRERVGDAKNITQSPFFLSAVKMWMNTPNDTMLRNEITKHLKLVKNEYGYENIILSSHLGESLLSANHVKDTLNSLLRLKIDEAVKNRRITFSDFYYCAFKKKIFYDIIAPFIDKKNNSTAVLIFRVLPEDYLYPLIQTWPTPSKTSETLLIRKDRDSVLFLNELRLRKNTALLLRIPLTRLDVPAVQAVLGYKGIFTGKDYRGKSVLAVIEPIPDTPWFMVAKVDSNEITAELRFRAVITGSFIVMLILLCYVGLTLIYSSRQKAIFKSETNFRNLFDHSPVGNSMTSLDGTVHANKTLCDMLGYTETELNTKTWKDVTHPDDIIPTEDIARLLVSGNLSQARIEKRFIHKNGSIVWADLSTYLQRDENGKPQFFITTIIDITERKAAEETLKILKYSIDTAPDGAYWMNKEACFVYANDTACKVLGYTREELMQMKVFDVNPGVDNEKWFQVWEYISENKSYHSQSVHRRKDGTEFPVELTFTYIKFGEHEFCNVFANDITERTRAEEIIHQSEKQFRTLFMSMSEGFYLSEIIYDENGNPHDYRYLETNPKFEEIMGLKRNQIVGRTYKEVVPVDTTQWLHNYFKVAQTGLPSTFEFYSDEYKMYLETYSYQTSKSQIGVFVRDITARKKIEEALQESEVHFRTLADSGQALIWSSGIDKKCDYFNQPWLKFTGRNIEQELGDGWVDGVHPDDLQQCVITYLEAFARREKFSMVYRLRHYSGEYRWIQDNGTPRYNSKGEFIGYIGHCLDITDRKLAEEEVKKINEELEHRVKERTTQLVDANKELEAFSYSVSHDLRAPLRALNGFARALLEDYSASFDAEGKRMLNVIMDNAKKMGNLIDDLLSFSRLNRSEINVSLVDMNAMVQSVFQELAITTDKRIEFRTQNIAEAYGDPSMVRLVWINLISNAIKFSSQKETCFIEIGSYTEERENIYYIKDNGAGFDMAYVSKLFGVFNRLHSVKEFEGTGVGLANVKRIILRLNGRVWAEGKVNEGATFYFTLPNRIVDHDS